MKKGNWKLAGMAAAACLLLGARAALAWWDTVLTTERPVPLVKEIEAETCVGPAKTDIVQDAQADGGKGGGAVLLRPGGSGLTTEIDVKPGLYAIFTIARDPEGKPDEYGMFTHTNHWGLMTLEVKEHKTGATRAWTMVVLYREQYFAAGEMYFPAYAGGKYTVTVKLPTEMARVSKDPGALRKFFDAGTGAFTKQKLMPMLVDRLELRDALGNCAGVAAKTQRMLMSDEEVAAMRRNFSGTRFNPPDAQVYREPYILTDGNPLDAEQRKARNEKLWSLVPDFNDHVSTDYASPYSYLFGRDSNGMLLNALMGYEKTGNPEYAWECSVLLCALADKYPAIDFFAQGTEGGAGVNLQFGFVFNALIGKHVYRGWAGGALLNMARAYDEMFEFIKDNEDLAKFVGTKIPWVKTPEDVVKLLDVNLLQAGMDACERHYVASDEAQVMIPLVQGINPVSERMMAQGIFTRMDLNLSLRGGIDDQAFSTFSRDGLHYMGSVNYYDAELDSIAQLLHRYRLAGGPARFDLLDGRRYPQMTEAGKSIAQAHAAGGFALNFGDGSDLRAGRNPAFAAPWPSRVLAGAGISVLESGQYQDNASLKRAVGLYFGIGRGHSHQDALTLEILGHDTRMVPDLGGRHEKERGSPNMRWNKVHNVVEVDEKNLENPYPGSTTDGTGWNTAFAPLPGAQYMEHRARGTSHPNLSLYGRQTAMIDVGDDSYIFDVFRVRGGKVHTYCFHGCPTKELDINAKLAPAASAEAKAYLAEHFEGTQQEGVVPAMLQADWVLDRGAQTPADPPTTRFALFGHEGEKVMVGNAYSQNYGYNYPFLYVQGRQDADGRESAFPAIIEPFAGKPFLAEKRQVAIEPGQKGAEAGVALEVKTTDGRTDLVYAGGKPMDTVTLDRQVKASGKFALVSRDAQGIVRAELVGGPELSDAGLTIKPARAAYVGKITGVDYDVQEFTVDQILPPRLLRGQIARMGADVSADRAGRTMQHAFELVELTAKGESTRVRHVKSAKYYQSTILNLDEKNNAVETEIEPAVFSCDTDFADGTTITGERQNKFWKAKLEESDRWMHIGHPGYRGSFPNTCSMDDFPDTNKDGRRVVRLIGTDEDQDAQGKSLKGKTILEMEVTRVTPNGETFYFKLPKEEKYQRGGWDYAYRLMVNEDGTRKWTAKYPGSSFVWRPEGGFKAADFDDADGDGKVKLSAGVYGPGDSMTLDAAVSVVRAATPGDYEVQSNVPLTLGLPRGEYTRAEISADGKTFVPIASKADGAQLVLALGEVTLADGKVTVRLGK